ncbi:PHD finger protein EHD3-like isoform X2 [Hibiscus syriacus]|uniref:PHD finger protein EHD3-like isoform X2 n=1 Tax=Hibiscus syriacus TaxID=106335 RepID=UPI001920660C|nr:PHD finger protein EHD3-like isoform X2 [Hibiscus syriacus]
MVKMGLQEETCNGEETECGEEIKCFRSEPVGNGCGYECMNDSGDGNSGASESFRTYKRRKQLSLCSKIRVQDGSKASSDQVTLPGTDHCASLNEKNYLLQRKWRNVVLEHMHQLLSGDEGGIQRCIQDALLFHRENGCNVTFKDSEELEAVISNSSSKESKPQTTTEICQRVFFEIIISEKFKSLCKLLFDNFQGIKFDRFFHLSLMNSRMKGGAYEQSPMLFSSDIQQIGCSGVAVEEEKREFCTQESEPLVKLEQTETCGMYKVCTCRRCGEKTDGKDCLVCGSCEVMYHVACIKCAVKEFPLKSWYCACCTEKGIGSPHEDCVVCERLNAPENLNKDAADENHNAHCETFTELGENSNRTIDQGLLQQENKTQHDCKICGSAVQQGEELRSCEHPYCPQKYYHVRCLTTKQLKSYYSLWYCPSCLCRTCLIDKDDDKIVLCDGCDAAYHIYCMKPPKTSVPKGKWFCRKCEAGIQQIRKAKRAYHNQENKLKRKGIGGKLACDNQETSRNQKNEEESDKSRGGVDMLLTAASTLHLEEKLNAIQMKT